MRILIYLSLLVSGCLAQSVPVEGELVAQGVTDFSHLVVRLETGGPAGSEEALVGFNGRFRFPHLAAGTYTLVVVDEADNEVTRDRVTVPAGPFLKVKLPDRPPEPSPGAGTVSVAQLRHKADPRALRACMQAGKLSQAGDYAGAAAELEKAIEFDPQLAEAHGNLGAQYVRLNRPAEAAAQFQQAIAIDPSNAVHQSNLALALAQLDRGAEAAGWARRALRIDSTNAAAHYVLGWFLAAVSGTRREAIEHLEVAARTLPSAGRLLEALRPGMNR